MSDDRVFAECARRLIPFMGLLYLVNYIDSTNAGFASLTMNQDLNFSPTIYGFGANHRPRKIFGFETPADKHQQQLQRPSGPTAKDGLGNHLCPASTAA